jgi:phage terminase Nu1 subunit (DNA packaging protein)
MSKTRGSRGSRPSLFPDLPPQETPPEPRPPSASSSRPRASKRSAEISLADWLRQASPAGLLELQHLVESSRPTSPAAAGRLVVRTLGEVAEWFGLELQTVKQWRVGPHGCPGEEGHYDLQAIARWRLARSSARGPSQAKADLEETALRLQNARAELKLAREAGELVTRAAAKSAIRQMFSRLKSQLEQLPDALAPLVPTEVRTDFRRDCVERLRIFLQQLTNFRFERDVSGAEPVAEDSSQEAAA